MRARNGGGSVSLDKRSGQWFYYYYEDNKRKNKRIGTRDQYPTKASAWKAAMPLHHAVETSAPVQLNLKTKQTVSVLIDDWKASGKYPERETTKRGYEAWFRNHIVPQWGKSPINALKAKPVAEWLDSLKLSPKSRVHVRNLIRQLWDYAMYAEVVPTQLNPMQQVHIKEATRRIKPRSLTKQEFQAFFGKLPEPFDLISLLCVSLGLRISECLALKWSDVNWLENRLKVERGIVRQIVDDVKTDGSRKTIYLDSSLIGALKSWRKRSSFTEAQDWIFASPTQLGAVPWSYPWVWVTFQKAAEASGLVKLGTHSLRHTYRSLLDSLGTPIAVQQKLMRHSDIRTTMNTYGDVVTNEESQANSRIANLVLGK